MVLIALGAGVLAALAAWAEERTMPFEDRFIFFPSRQLVATPADAGLAFEDVRIGRNGRLHGWFVPGAGPTTLLWFHGNAGNISHRVQMMAPLRDALAASIFIFDYSGYGLSAGQPSEQATYEDARAALDYLRSRKDVRADRIVYFGKSLGAAVAVALAVEEVPYRLVVQSAFTSIRDLAAHHYPFLPLRGLLTTRFDTEERIRHVRAQVLIVHGERDDIVPVEHAHRLFDAAPEPKRLLIVQGASHNDVLEAGGQRYLDALREFIAADDRPR